MSSNGNNSQNDYLEFVRPGFAIMLPTVLIAPAVALVLLPFANAVLSFSIGGSLTLLAAALLWKGGLKITLKQGSKSAVLQVGKAKIDTAYVKRAEAFTGIEAKMEQGPRLNALSYIQFRPGIQGVVKVALDDPSDPTPYWLFSSRRAFELAELLNKAKN